MENEISYGDFFRQAPAMSSSREKITGVVCGVRVERVLREEAKYLGRTKSHDAHDAKW